jgi:8-oxo-dGTP pyrophosphatase MutT (NUDIX family)
VIRRVSTALAGSFRIFDVLRHEMADDSGRTREAFTMRCPDWVSIVPVTDAGEIVLVRQYRHGIDAPTLEVPGGVIDAGESPQEAALRELREETGYAAGGAIEPLGFTHPNPPIQSNRHFMFLARGARRAFETDFDPGEECELVLLAEDEVRRAIADGRITHALVIVALSRAFDALSPRR